MRSIFLVLVMSCAQPAPLDDDAGTTDDVATMDVAKMCGATEKLCGINCTDVTKDPNNCGACAKKCAATQYCAAGKCSDTCKMPMAVCGQFCVDLTNDHDNCSKCGMGCAVDQNCVSGACVKKCPVGLTVCDMDCVSTISDPNHCGDCNTACNMGEICSGSICCKQGQIACNGFCTNVQGDNDNCGGCGLACGGNTPYCLNGVCQAGAQGGQARDVMGNWLPITFVPCGNGTIGNCTEPTAEMSCTTIGRKLVSHASDGTIGVVSLGAVSSCYWSISYFKNMNPLVANQCLVGVSNAKWSSCCGLSNWHGNIVTVPSTLNQVFGYIYTNDSGYSNMYPNMTGTTWGCQSLSTPPPPRNGCSTYYVACK